MATKKKSTKKASSGRFVPLKEIGRTKGKGDTKRGGRDSRSGRFVPLEEAGRIKGKGEPKRTASTGPRIGRGDPYE